jgi:5-enolpyruvylshikimate-3-phosphate synthase
MPDPLPIARSAAPVDASIRVPGSKSLSNRHLVLAALADAPTQLRGLLACDDCDRLLAALDAVGARHRIGSSSSPCGGAPVRPPRVSISATAGRPRGS